MKSYFSAIIPREPWYCGRSDLEYMYHTTVNLPHYLGSTTVDLGVKGQLWAPILMNAVTGIANADRIKTIITQTMCAHENSHHYARHARFTVPPSSRSAIAQWNCRIGGITDSSYANQLKIPAKTQQQRLLNVTKSGVNVENVPIIGMSEIANVQQQPGPLPQAAVLQQNVTQNDNITTNMTELTSPTKRLPI